MPRTLKSRPSSFALSLLSLGEDFIGGLSTRTRYLARADPWPLPSKQCALVFLAAAAILFAEACDFEQPAAPIESDEMTVHPAAEEDYVPRTRPSARLLRERLEAIGEEVGSGIAKTVEDAKGQRYVISMWQEADEVVRPSLAGVYGCSAEYHREGIQQRLVDNWALEALARAYAYLYRHEGLRTPVNEIAVAGRDRWGARWDHTLNQLFKTSEFQGH